MLTYFLFKIFLSVIDSYFLLFLVNKILMLFRHPVLSPSPREGELTHLILEFLNF